MTEKQIEQRQEAYSRSCGVCPVCKKPFQNGQYGHKIGNREIYRKKYGSWIIDHTKNGEYVCSLPCNNSVDVGSSYGNHLEVIADILIYEYMQMWGVSGLGKLADKITEKYKGVNNEQ